MTNKRIDKKIMSWFWGLIRLWPVIPIFVILLSFLFQFNKGYWEFGPSNLIETLDIGILDFLFNSFGPFEDIFDLFYMYLLPFFLREIFEGILVFSDLPLYSYFSLIYSFIFYQVWVSILQILFNVLMILPNITNWFIEKFNHLGNKGDY